MEHDHSSYYYHHHYHYYYYYYVYIYIYIIYINTQYDSHHFQFHSPGAVPRFGTGHRPLMAPAEIPVSGSRNRLVRCRMARGAGAGLTWRSQLEPPSAG